MVAMADLDWGFIGEENCVMRFLAGPHLYGIDDRMPAVRDEIAVVIERPEFVIGRHAFRPRTYETSDLRVTELSLRDFVRRVLNGNLTMMLPLLAPDAAIIYRSTVGKDLFPEPEAMLGPSLPASLAAYMRAKAAELENGYDRDLAALLVRLGHQGIEAMNDHCVTLPAPEPLRGRIRQINRGEVSEVDALREIEELISGLQVAPFYMRDPPVEAEYEQWLISVHVEHWTRTWRPAILE